MTNRTGFIHKERSKSLKNKNFSYSISLNFRRFSSTIFLDVCLREDKINESGRIKSGKEVSQKAGNRRKCKVRIKFDCGISCKGCIDKSLDDVVLVILTFEI